MGTADLRRALQDPGSAWKILVEAREKQRSISQYLEAIQDSDTRSGETELDAFERVLRDGGIVSRTIIEEGIYADTLDDLERECGRASVVELSKRSWRQAQRATLMSSDSLLGSLQRPYAIDTDVRRDGFEAAIPIAEVLAGTRAINGGNLQGSYLIEPAVTQKRLVRVAEGAEIPKATIRLGDRNIVLYKFGRGIELTYETLRRETLDRLRMWVQELAVQAEIDKLAAILTILVNGDGNVNTTPTTYNLLTLDAAATSQTLTVKAWLSFLGKFKNPYVATHVFAREAEALKIKLMNTGSANLPIGTIQIAGGTLMPNIRPINRTLSPVLGLGETDDAPTAKIVAIDRRVAIERVVETGSEITENERYISKQTEAMFMTENEGYQVGSGNANGTKILDMAA
jgi:hypothetical protein